MSLSTLPLSYCTNVHPGRTVDEVISGLQAFTIPTRKRFDQNIAAGLWLPASAIDEINADPKQLDRLRTVLEDGELVCYTLNTFPYGNFHSERVKEQVYLPDWSSPERLNYTIACAQALSKLMPEGTEGSLSTVPLGFKMFDHAASFLLECVDQLLNLAVMLDELHDETGKVIRLAIEPEPLCVLETTAETIDFFSQLFEIADRRNQLDVAKRHLGVCYDVCHQSVEFEEIPSSIQALADQGIRINKVHLTCAIQVDSPGTRPETRQELAEYVEPRYLHQTFAQGEGGVRSVLDLSRELCDSPSEEFLSADMWRVHFHVPVNCESIGALGTTRADLQKAIQAVDKLDYAPHLEVETYTWSVLPGQQDVDLVSGLVGELEATRSLIDATLQSSQK